MEVKRGEIMRYYISDLHAYHKNINDRLDGRGFPSVEEMNKFMINQWNSRVKRNDEVIILGDVSFGSVKETTDFVRQLNGKKYLIIGNHDRFLDRKEFDRSLFMDIVPYKEMNDEGRRVILCHYPVFCYKGQYRTDEQGQPTVYMLHGHVHNTLDMKLLDQFVDITRNTKRRSKGLREPKSIPCNMINCFCMYSNYIPWTLDEWIEFDEQRRKNPQYKGDEGDND